jgi:beta-mannanase
VVRNRPLKPLAKPNFRVTVVLIALAALILLTVLATRPAGADAAPASKKIGLDGQRALGGVARKPLACPKRKDLLARNVHGARSAEARRRQTARAASACKTPAPTPPPVNPTSLYWGAWIGSQLTGSEAPWDMSAVSQFEAQTGKPVSLIHFAAPFADCSHSPCTNYSFPTKPMQTIREHGSIPFFSWSSQSTPSSLNEPDYQLSDVIAGTYDSYIRSFAEEAKAWGHPFFLRFNWEMNGNWFPWAEGVNGNNPGEYVAAWRHVHDIFTAVGATNATWTWCPNVDPKHEFTDVAAFYPGSAYVDWTSLDGYNWGGKRWMSFDETFSSTYHRIVDEVAPGKPMVIGEVGSSEVGGSKSAWIAEMLQKLPTEYQGVRAVLWFDKLEEGDWPIDSSPSSQSAFASGIGSPAYLSNSFSQLGPGTVPVPG